MPRRQGARLASRLCCDERVEQDLSTLVAQHAIAHAVQLAVPFTSNASNKSFDAQASPSTAPMRLATALQQDPLVLLHEDLSSVMTYRYIPAVPLGRLCAEASQLLQAQPEMHFLAVTAGSRMDSASGSAAITPDGIFHLTLPQATYQMLGLLGKRCHSGDLFYITVNLRSKTFVPGRTFHDKVVERLDAVLPGMPLLCLGEKGGVPVELSLPCLGGVGVNGGEANGGHRGPAGAATNVGGSSSSKHDAQAGVKGSRGSQGAKAGEGVGLGFKDLGARHTSWRITGLQVPLPTRGLLQRCMEHGRQGARRAGGSGGGRDGGEASAMEVDGEGAVATGSGCTAVDGEALATDAAHGWQPVEEDLVSELHTWLGAVACGLGPSACDSLLPDSLSYTAAQGVLHCRTYTGLLSSTTVLHLLHGARRLVELGAAPWACLSCWGLPHSPVAWVGHEHLPHPEGMAEESQFSVLVLPEGGVCVLKAMGANEVPVPQPQK